MVCSVCGYDEFVEHKVLWPELISAWQLAEHEAAYINRQQGLVCRRCNSNLRSMALAGSIASLFGGGLLQDVIRSGRMGEAHVLEINPAGTLSPWLSELPGHRLVSWPDYDMMDLALPDGSVDLVVHSDVLEHVEHPLRGMQECFRVLRSGGVCAFTVPVLVDRLSRSRAGLPASYHGSDDEQWGDYVVHSEFGCDIWTLVMRAGFGAVTIFALEYPAGVALIAKKA